VVKDAQGELVELRCSYVENSKSGQDTSGINAKGTLHWVSATHALPVEVRLYDRLFKVEDPSSEEGDFKEYINPDSLTVVNGYAEPALQSAVAGDRFQFLRKGYFCADKESTPERIVLNRTVTLKDTWAKVAAK
jgi:glutaminyl-tRNA synthetase